MRIKDDRILLKATRFIGSRKFGEAIRLLEPEVVRYHDSFRYYYLLAIACLRSGDFGGALTYFRRAREIKMREPSVLLGLAVLHLRRGETDRAVELYLETLEKDPKNRRAKKALQVIRKRGDPEALAAYLETGKVEALYPPTPTAPLSFAAAALYAAAAAAVIAAGIYAASFAGLIDLPKKPLLQDRDRRRRSGNG
jgi:tetratricopeptide (TPR) repeat protein